MRSGDGAWFVRLCQLLTGQPMLAAVLVLLSSTPCSPGTVRGSKPTQMWTPLGCSVQSRRPPERLGVGQDRHGTRRRLEVVVDFVTGSVSTTGDCHEASMARAQAPVSGTGPRAVTAGRHQDLIRHTWTTHR